MESLLTLPHNPYVDDLPTYNAGLNIQKAREMSGKTHVAALASNENPFGCSPTVQERLRLLDPSRYSDSDSSALRTALAERHAIEQDRIVIGNGSEEIITNIARAFLRPGDYVLTVAPAFGLHEIQPRAMGATVTKVPMTPEGGFDIARLRAELAKAPRLFFLSSPWNPVGASLTSSELVALIDACGPQTIFVYDEAYFEFRDTESPDGLAMFAGSNVHWAVLRTFSKAYGLAGLRVGYGFMREPAMAKLINLVRTPFNVNAAAQAAAVAALQDEKWMMDHAAIIVAQRNALRKDLQALGLKVAPSQANFLFIDLGLPAKPVSTALLKQAIICKAWVEPGYENYLRVSVGLPEENKHFIDAMHRLMT